MGRTYAKKLFVAYMEFKLNYISCILSDDPNPQIGHTLQLPRSPLAVTTEAQPPRLPQSWTGPSAPQHRNRPPGVLDSQQRTRPGAP